MRTFGFSLRVLLWAFNRKASSVSLKCFSVKVILPMSSPHFFPQTPNSLLDCLSTTPLVFSHKHLLICYMTILRGPMSWSSACLLIVNSIFKTLLHSCVLLCTAKRSHASLWMLCCLDFSSRNPRSSLFSSFFHEALGHRLHSANDFTTLEEGWPSPWF